jgi:hypothetical protein
MNTAPNVSDTVWSWVTDPTFQSVLGVLILLAVCWGAIHMLSRLRDSNTQDVLTQEMLRRNFEEMKSGGVINEAEFRNIASLLTDQGRRSTSSASDTTQQPPAPESNEK